MRKFAARPSDRWWSEFKFALNQVSGAVDPAIPLADMISRWTGISAGLGESTPRRRPQLERYFNQPR